MWRLLGTLKFWDKSDSIAARLLEPVSKIYNAISSARYSSVTPETVAVPTICVGNVVVGGAGKTPVAAAVCELLKSEERTPHIISSGYGGYIKNVVRVDDKIHTYLQVGDEALLLSRIAPTWIGKNKIHACRAASSAGADVVVMDDGLQNNTVVKDLSILVVDSGQGFGNEKVLPAGPLRETVESGVRKSDVVLIIGEGSEAIENRVLSVSKDIRIYHARTEAVNPTPENDRKVIGFCGLGYPNKFRMSLEQARYNVVDFIAFRDHHAYTITEIQRLITTARRVNARLVTTWKDYVKIPNVFKDDIEAIGVRLKIEEDEFGRFLVEAISRDK
ncbi:MAG: tetraacyldisaccharide 4'-kinase [Holosporales bacterium]|nr:tetraacyldisaccharide 4'-kinase [Holosporales bacterium]